MSSPPTLTKGAVLRVIRAEGNSLEVPPRLQLLMMKRLPSRTADPNELDKFRWVARIPVESNQL